MHDYGKSVQPYIIVTGPSSTELNHFYISVDQVLYELSSVMEAVNICFKTFHVFCLEYPLESEHMWLIFQKGLFGFKTKYDSNFAHAETIIHALSVAHSAKEKMKPNWLKLLLLLS